MPMYGAANTSAKSSTGPIIAVGIVVVVVAITGLVSTVAFTSGGGDSSVAETGYTPEYEPAPHSGATDTPSTWSMPSTTTTTTTTRSTSSTTSTSSSTSRSSETVAPPSGPEPVHKLADHPLFANADYGLQNFACELPRWQTNPSAAARFFRGAQQCLDKSWSTLLRALDLPFREPTLKFPSGRTWTSPCGTHNADTGVAAFYCGSNETIYMPFEALQTQQYGARPGVYLALFAHEYAHHVQQLSGILETYADAQYEVGADSAKGLELSRRSELQAQCFSGMFLGSTTGQGGDVNQQIYREAWNSQNRGDEHHSGPRDHGTSEHTRAWWQQGATTNRTQKCNTWAAGSADVS